MQMNIISQYSHKETQTLRWNNLNDPRISCNRCINESWRYWYSGKWNLFSHKQIMRVQFHCNSARVVSTLWCYSKASLRTSAHSSESPQHLWGEDTNHYHLLTLEASWAQDSMRKAKVADILLPKVESQ